MVVNEVKDFMEAQSTGDKEITKEYILNHKLENTTQMEPYKWYAEMIKKLQDFEKLHNLTAVNETAEAPVFGKLKNRTEEIEKW